MGSAWEDGRHAWRRLDRWRRENDACLQGEASTIKALGDIRRVRRLLDQTEASAVRAARREGRSWGDIATKLGVTRQSAWERWRDVADRDEPPPSLDPADVDVLLGLVVEELTRDRKHSVRHGSVMPIKSRIDGDRGVLAVHYETDDGDYAYIRFQGLKRGPNGWRLGGGSGSRLGEGGPTSRSWFRSGFFGAGDEGGWCFGGIPADQSVRTVRVDTGAGSTVEDTVERDRVVLLIARDGGPGSATVELLDAHDGLIGSGRLLEART
jgi:hypothetical protein